MDKGCGSESWLLTNGLRGHDSESSGITRLKTSGLETTGPGEAIGACLLLFFQEQDDEVGLSKGYEPTISNFGHTLF